MNNIIEVFEKTVASFPLKTAIICNEKEFTYQELDRKVTNFASNLQTLWGIQPGDKVAILLPNCAEFIIVYLGIIRSGGVALPINIRLKPPEISFILGNANACALIAHKKTWSTALEVLPKLSGIKHIMSVNFEHETATSIDRFISGGKSDRGAPDLLPEDVAAIIYTSGTTGLPKGAMLMHRNLIFNAHSTIHGFDFQHHERHLVTVPLFHVTGLNTILVTSLMLGSTLIVSDKYFPRDILELIEHYQVNTYFAAPTTYLLMFDLEDIGTFDLSSIRIFVYSGAPMPPRAILRLRKLVPGIELVNLYGSTEATSVTTVLPAADALRNIESVGRTVSDLQLKVIDPGGVELPPGEIGELCVKGASVFRGYYENPEATTEAFIGDWYRTGDSAIINDEGYVFLKGRKKELIIVAGENVYPIEVENVICSIPQVLEAAVIGEDDPIMGQVVKAVVVLERGTKLPVADIKNHCTDNLASFKVPQSVDFIGHLPRNPSGKVMKRLLD